MTEATHDTHRCCCGVVGLEGLTRTPPAKPDAQRLTVAPKAHLRFDFLAIVNREVVEPAQAVRKLGTDMALRLSGVLG